MSEVLTAEKILEEGQERLLPLVQYVLKRSNIPLALSGDAEEKIRKLRRAIAVRNICLFRELKSVLQAFNRVGIEAILLKGAMMEGLYPGGLRPFTDIDLLIHRQKLSRVIEVLSNLGYRPHHPELRPGAEAFHGEVTYVKDGEFPVMIEPHWTLSDPYLYTDEVNMEEVWERAKKASIDGVDSFVLCPEDCVLHSCLHLFDHCQSDWLVSSCDIAELIHHYDGKLDWEAFLSRVVRYRVGLPVQFAIQKTVELFKPPIPSLVLKELSTYKPRRFERWAFTLLASPGLEGALGSRFLVQFLTIPRARLKLRRFLISLFPSREFMLNCYAIKKPELLFLYYPLYLKDIFLIAVKASFNSVTGGKNTHKPPSPSRIELDGEGTS